MPGLTAFLVEHPGCHEQYCSTCGGLLHFERNLDAYLAHSAPLKDQLLKIEAREPRRRAGRFDLKECGSRIPLLLNRLPALDMNLVIEAWEHRVRRDALFAMLIWNWRTKWWGLPESLLLAAMEGLSHRAIHDRELLNSMVSRFPALVERVPIPAKQIRKDREEDARETRIREES